MDHIALLAPDDAQAELCRELGEAFRFAALLDWPGDERRQKEANRDLGRHAHGSMGRGF
jgi:hypothetical protein